jgi:ABC-type multidrug transport system permease subunit
MTTQPPLAIEAAGLVRSFGATRAVDGVDLAVRSGTVYGVLGPNGAGKTTTIRMLATLALVIVFAFGLSWVFTTLGLLLRSPNAVMNAGFMGIFPLTFLSNVFVEPETLPAALKAFVDVNPVSILATASRGLMHGNADGTEILIVLLTAAALTAIFAPLTTRLYRRG